MIKVAKYLLFIIVFYSCGRKSNNSQVDATNSNAHIREIEFCLSNDVAISNIQDERLLMNLRGVSKCLFLYVPANNCLTCYESVFEYLGKVDESICRRIYILTPQENLRLYKLICQRYQINGGVYHLKHGEGCFPKINAPIIFTVDDELEVVSSFITEKHDTQSLSNFIEHLY